MNLNALILYFILNLTFTYSSSEHVKHVEDPVAKHDANMCGVYLCSSFSDKATKYIQEGCIGTFRDWLLENTHINDNTNNELQMNSILLSNSVCVVEDNIPLDTTLQLTLFSFFLSLFIGYNPSFKLLKQRLQIFTICLFGLMKGTLAVSSGANEPIADNELGLTAKDCALQYCESKDGMGLWMSLVNECISNPNPYFMSTNHNYDYNSVNSCENVYGTGITPFILGSLMGFMAFVGFNLGIFFRNK